MIVYLSVTLAVCALGPAENPGPGGHLVQCAAAGAREKSQRGIECQPARGPAGSCREGAQTALASEPGVRQPDPAGANGAAPAGAAGTGGGPHSVISSSTPPVYAGPLMALWHLMGSRYHGCWVESYWQVKFCRHSIFSHGCLSQGGRHSLHGSWGSMRHLDVV